MRPIFALLLVFCPPVLLMLPGGIAIAADTLDQFYLDDDGSFGIGDAAAQTFTVGTTGLLSRVELRLGRSSGPDGTVVVYIRNAEMGISAGPNLGALTLPRINLPSPIQSDEYISLDFSSQEIHVNAGEHFAVIVDIRDTPGVEWGLGRTVQTPSGLPMGGYPDGLAFVPAGSSWAVLPYNPSFPDTVGLDFNFRTFVQTVPEPSTLAIVCFLYVVGLGVRLRPKR